MSSVNFRLCFDWNISISDSPSCHMDRFNFRCCYRHQMTPDSVCVYLSLSRLSSCDASGRWLTAPWKANRWQENISNNHRRHRPRERDPTETDPRQSRRAAVMESVLQTRAAESFDKSLNVTWGLENWAINQPDGFIRRRRRHTAAVAIIIGRTVNKQTILSAIIHLQTLNMEDRCCSRNVL